MSRHFGSRPGEIGSSSVMRYIVSLALVLVLAGMAGCTETAASITRPVPHYPTMQDVHVVPGRRPQTLNRLRSSTKTIFVTPDTPSELQAWYEWMLPREGWLQRTTGVAHEGIAFHSDGGCPLFYLDITWMALTSGLTEVQVEEVVLECR